MNDKLNTLGKMLVAEVRDETLEAFKKTLQGKYKSISAIKLKSLIDKLCIKDTDILYKIVLDVIDSSLYNTLWMIEQSDEIDLVYRNPNNPDKTTSFKEISDGLCGELYSEEGWIEKYSKYPPSMKLQLINNLSYFAKKVHLLLKCLRINIAQVIKFNILLVIKMD